MTNKGIVKEVLKTKKRLVNSKNLLTFANENKS